TGRPLSGRHLVADLSAVPHGSARAGRTGTRSKVPPQVPRALRSTPPLTRPPQEFSPMDRRFLVASLAALGLAPALLAQQFTYNAAALPSGASIWTDGVVIADLNGDGALDIAFAEAGGTYATGAAAQQRMYTNNGSAVFADSSASLNVANFGSRMVIAEDFDNDGDLDLMYAPDSVYPSPNKKPVLLLNNGSGVFTNVSATNLPNVFMCAFCVCAGDVDNDGDLDVVFTDGGTFGNTATM